MTARNPHAAVEDEVQENKLTYCTIDKIEQDHRCCEKGSWDILKVGVHVAEDRMEAEDKGVLVQRALGFSIVRSLCAIDADELGSTVD